VSAGVFVLGMHRSGTSAVTRLVSLLGPTTPPDEDLVQPTEKNPKGYWESETLVAFNERLLRALDCDMGCPIALEPGWERDARLDPLRGEARRVVDEVYPTPPWVWKDPRLCLTLAFWRSVLDVRPAVILVNRNPLETAASALKVRSEQGKVYALALWERYLREALVQIEGAPVLVTSYADALTDPLAWCERARAFLDGAGVEVRAPREAAVVAFIDTGLRHAEFTRADVDGDPEVSAAQRALYAALEELEGDHTPFAPPSLPAESPTTEALLAERRRALRIKQELTLELERRSRWGARLRRSRYAAPARRLLGALHVR
jgi:hypothetical protein